METQETELEKELKQMNNDVLYSAMKCFIERQAKEMNVDFRNIYLKINQDCRCICVHEMLYDGETLNYDHSEHTS